MNPACYKYVVFKIFIVFSDSSANINYNYFIDLNWLSATGTFVVGDNVTRNNNSSNTLKLNNSKYSEWRKDLINVLRAANLPFSIKMVDLG